MVKRGTIALDLDAIFSALSHPIRRAMLEQLAGGDATVSELARPHGVSLPAISRHLRVLEAAGLLKEEPHGRGEDGRPTWRDLAIRPTGRRGERVRFPRGIPGSRAFRTNRRNLRIRGDAGTCPDRERRVRGHPGQDEGHAEVRLRDGRGPRGDARLRNGGRGPRDDRALRRIGGGTEEERRAAEERASERSCSEERARYDEDLRRTTRTRVESTHGPS